LRHVPKVAVLALLASCGSDAVGDEQVDSGGADGDGNVPDTGMPDGGDAEITEPDAAQDAEVDAETPIDDSPTLTWPQLQNLPNNRVFVRWDPPSPQDIPPGKTIVGYEVSLDDGTSTTTKEVTNTFTALDILSPTTPYIISVRAIYDDNTYSQASTEKIVDTDESLLARYTMDEGAGTFVGDSSGNGNDGYLVYFDPVTAWTQGMINTGLLFDGYDDHVDVDDPANPGARFDFDSSKPFTIEAWVRRSGGITMYPTIFSKMDYMTPSVQNGYWFGYTPSDNLHFELISNLSANDMIVVNTMTSYATNLPQSVAVTYDGSKSYLGVSIYVNGAAQTIDPLMSGGTLTGQILNPAPARIGASVGYGGPVWGVDMPLPGIFDEVTIYEDKIVGGAIQQNHCARKTLKNEAGDPTSQPTECP
jgi:hypothetical protein